jgi:replication factor C subunit 3/5
MAFEVVDENNVYTCVGHPLKSDISNIVDWMLNETFSEAYEKVQALKIIKGLSLQVPLFYLFSSRPFNIFFFYRIS